MQEAKFLYILVNTFSTYALIYFQFSTAVKRTLNQKRSLTSMHKKIQIHFFWFHFAMTKKCYEGLYDILLSINPFHDTGFFLYP